MFFNPYTITFITKNLPTLIDNYKPIQRCPISTPNNPFIIQKEKRKISAQRSRNKGKKSGVKTESCVDKIKGRSSIERMLKKREGRKRNKGDP